MGRRCCAGHYYGLKKRVTEGRKCGLRGNDDVIARRITHYSVIESTPSLLCCSRTMASSFSLSPHSKTTILVRAVFHSFKEI
jgi:hypothetical protein